MLGHINASVWDYQLWCHWLQCSKEQITKCNSAEPAKAPSPPTSSPGSFSLAREKFPGDEVASPPRLSSLKMFREEEGAAVIAD